MNDHRIRHFLRNLRIERDNAALYTRLAELAAEPQLARAYRRIAEGEQQSASFWQAQLRDLGVEAPASRPRLRVKVLGTLAKWFGAGFVMPTVVRLEHADHIETPVDRARHREHFVAVDDRGSLVYRQRGASGNTLRASVLGANDGLVSNASLVMGMAGAASDNDVVLLAGLAGLIAGACSMALGEWLSVESSREFYQAQITARAERLAVAPEEGERSIASIYRAKGLESVKADQLAEHLTDNLATALDTLVREDLGVDPADLGGSAWSAAISSFCFFALGAIFPVAPYLVLGGDVALFTSMGTTFVGLCLIAIGTSLFTGRSLVFSIARQALITAAAAAITFSIGYMLGTAVTG